MNRLSPRIDLKQPSLLEECAVAKAVLNLSISAAEDRGAIFTRHEVVEFILDLVEYQSDQPLWKYRLLEPSFGNGDFLFPAVERLLSAWEAADRPVPAASLSDAIRAVELHWDSYVTTRTKLIKRLLRANFSEQDVEGLIEKWLVFGDFLLSKFDCGFDFVVGNPPYIRQELIADELMEEYRSRFSTIYDRADIYVPFIEHALQNLSLNGRLGFICADRWMKNRYGSRLRALVARDFHLDVFVDMVDTPAFHSNVIAYPAITVFSREKGNATRAAYRPKIDREALSRLARVLRKDEEPDESGLVSEIQDVTNDDQPWIFDRSDRLVLVRRLEKETPTLEEVGCIVGIGVATGADKAFIGRYDEMPVESSRKLPLVMTKDIASGRVEWRGFGVINPFDESGRLVSLDEFPKMKAYLEQRKDVIAGRHVATKSPANWYRTIDRINQALTYRPKLLIPDIKGDAHIVYDDGKYYPHHNLYYIVSQEWHIRALQAVLLSGIARLFVEAYSTKMRGGFLRFHAQYLRRIRIPRWQTVSPDLQRMLIAAGESLEVAACDEAVCRLYDLTSDERRILFAESL